MKNNKKIITNKILVDSKGNLDAMQFAYQAKMFILKPKALARLLFADPFPQHVTMPFN